MNKDASNAVTAKERTKGWPDPDLILAHQRLQNWIEKVVWMVYRPTEIMFLADHCCSFF